MRVNKGQQTGQQSEDFSFLFCIRFHSHTHTCVHICYLLSYADVCVSVYLFAYESRRLLTFQLEKSREIYEREYSTILYPVFKLQEAEHDY